MVRWDVGSVAAVMQGVGIAFAVGLMVFLGRLYSLEYFSELGIPVSEISLSAVDYAIASPTISIIGVTTCLLMALYPIASDKLSSSELPSAFLVIVGAVLAFIGLMAPVAAFAISHDLLGGLLLGIATPASVYAGVAFGTLSPKDLVKGRGISLGRWRDPVRILIAVSVIGIMVWALFRAASFTTSVAQVEVRDLVNSAPKATVHIKPQDDSIQKVGVVFISDKFVYLQTANDKGYKLIAVPIDSVRRIDYGTE